MSTPALASEVTGGNEVMLSACPPEATGAGGHGHADPAGDGGAPPITLVSSRSRVAIRQARRERRALIALSLAILVVLLLATVAILAARSSGGLPGASLALPVRDAGAVVVG